MTCAEFTAFLDEYIAGQLPAAVRTAFEAHLAECSACIAYLHSYRETIKLAKAAFAPVDQAVPDAVPDQLLKAMLTAQRKHR